ncbi:MAG: serine--tRNA ligase [Victivallales bacterium]|nr:serine--tRNA ligase [Victivallales bacterium]MCF7889329.1 serine--tRNA ligase [Victivallales bacterium]
MLDINLIRQKTEYVANALRKRGIETDFSDLLYIDKQRREKILQGDKLKAFRNKVSSEIPRLKKSGQDVSAKLTEMKNTSEQIKRVDEELNKLTSKLNKILVELPNIPADDVPPGGKENNRVLRTYGDKPVFEFKPHNHVELVTKLGLVDYTRGVKMGGNGFWLYKGKGAQLEWALINYFIEEHTKDGYEFVLPPHLLINKCGYTAGQFPKFSDDVFHIEGEDGESTHFLLPTSETALINFHSNEVLKEDKLPKKYFAYTPCYRREAGSYRAAERGMIRGHQFNKVEMFQFTTPETSETALEELVGKAERLVKGLGLHHQVSALAAGDCSASMSKTLDIEVWIPSMNEYKEVSSASNALDYQARRGNIKFKRRKTGKNEFIHSLNASGLATSRLFPAILEQFQQKNGSVVVPEPLRKYMGTDVIEPVEN